MTQLGIISFNGTPTALLPLRPLVPQRAMDACQKLRGRAAGSTNVAAAVRMAARMLGELSPQVQKHILVLTDGEIECVIDPLPNTLTWLAKAGIIYEQVDVDQNARCQHSLDSRGDHAIMICVDASGSMGQNSAIQIRREDCGRVAVEEIILRMAARTLPTCFKKGAIASDTTREPFQH